MPRAQGRGLRAFPPHPGQLPRGCCCSEQSQGTPGSRTGPSRQDTAGPRPTGLEEEVELRKGWGDPHMPLSVSLHWYQPGGRWQAGALFPLALASALLAPGDLCKYPGPHGGCRLWHLSPPSPEVGECVKGQGPGWGLRFVCGALSSPFLRCPRRSESAPHSHVDPLDLGPARPQAGGPSFLLCLFLPVGLARAWSHEDTPSIPALGHQHLPTFLPLRTQPAAPAMDRWYLGESPDPRPPTFSDSNTGVCPVTFQCTSSSPERQEKQK